MLKLRPIALVAVALSTAAVAADRISLDNLVITLGATTWRIPNAQLFGASLPESELKQLFSGDAAAIDARLARLSASRATIASMSSETRGAADIERGSFRELVAEDIANGRVGVWRAAGGESTIEGHDGAVDRFTWGPLVSKGVDLRLMTRIALNARAGADEPLKPLLDEEAVETLHGESSDRALVVDAGRVSLTGVRARPLATPMEQLFDRLAKSDRDKPDAALIRDLLDALLSFEAGAFEARAINVTGKGEPLDKPYSVKIARIGANKLSGGGAEAAAVESFALSASDGGRLVVESVGMHDMQLLPMLKDGAWPKVAHLDAKGVSADLPDPKTSEKSRVIFHIDNASADFGNFRETTPTKFSAKIDHAVVDLAARGETEATAQFLALGYKTLDFSAAAASEWREKTSEATIGPIVLDGRDMGVLRFAAELGNVSSALFSSSPVVSKAASLAISLKSVDVTLEGGELIGRMLAAEAKDRKITIDKARADYAKTAGEGFTALAGGGEKAKKIGAAVAAYIMQPGRLRIHITAPRGVNALDALAKQPGEIIEAAEVEAVVER